MLEVLRRQNMTNCVCVVTRYFGGVLLGAGGLLRAYTKSAGDALATAGTSVVRPWSCMDVPCSYSGAERLKTECAAMGGIVEDVEYSSSVTLKVLIPAETEADFTARIFDISGGTVTPLRTRRDAQSRENKIELGRTLRLKSLISAGGFKCRGAIDVKRSTP